MLLKIEVKIKWYYLNVLPTKDWLNKLGNTLGIIKNVVTESKKDIHCILVGKQAEKKLYIMFPWPWVYNIYLYMFTCISKCAQEEV